MSVFGCVRNCDGRHSVEAYGRATSRVPQRLKQKRATSGWACPEEIE